jgi:hypothetical protein
MLHSPERMTNGENPEPSIQQHGAVVTPQQQEAEETYVDPVMERVKDHALRILSEAIETEGMSEESAATCWDIFYSARTSAELAAKLQPLDVPNTVKHQLYRAFEQHRELPKTTTLKDRLDRAVAVIHRVAQLHKVPAHGSSLLDISETHPHVSKALAEAALKESEKE